MKTPNDLIEEKKTECIHRRREAAQDGKAEISALYSTFLDWLVEIKGSAEAPTSGPWSVWHHGGECGLHTENGELLIGLSVEDKPGLERVKEVHNASIQRLALSTTYLEVTP